MIAIVESGSTKSEWVILNEEGELLQNIKTQGFNPDFHTSEFISTTLNQNEELDKIKHQIHQLFFYGASCSSKLLKIIVQKGLQVVFPNATIKVEHDLLAAAYSLYDGEPIISCIIGTGSNSAYFDGENLTEMVPALGFIMGDEAGGGYFGKQLLSAYFYKKLPPHIQEDVFTTYKLSWNNTRSKIYGDIHANVFMASFMPFIVKYKDDPYINNLLKEGFSRFIDAHVVCYHEHKHAKVCFVGTISYLFKDMIEVELNKRGYQLGKVIKSPAMELVNYHKYFLNVFKSSDECSYNLNGIGVHNNRINK